MSLHLKCDGCGTSLRDDDAYGAGGLPAITGERADGWGGGELPSGRFDWCHDCAVVAFEAVKSRSLGHTPRKG